MEKGAAPSPEQSQEMLSNCTLLSFFLIAALIVQYVLEELFISPNGELPLWYAISTCFNPNASFSVQGITYDAFTLRPIVAGELEGNACPAVPTDSPPPIDITLEASDGYRMGGRYSAILMMPANTYTSFDFEVLNAKGDRLIERDAVSFGPDDAFPWQADPAHISDASPLPFRHYAASASTSECTPGNDSCRYASDGACDDGGSGAEFAYCERGTDCEDCTDARRRRLGNGAELAEDRDHKDGGFSQAPAQFARTPASTGSTAWGVPVPLRMAAHGGATADDEHEQLQPADHPTARRLLKGGFNGGRGGSSLSGSRWGSASPVSRSYSPSATRRHNGIVYGGSAAYLVRGRSYSGGERPYSYHSAHSVYAQHSYILVVGSGGYGCYSCSGTRRTCEPHCPDDCRQRSDCNGNRYTVVQYEQDYYDVGLSLHVPTEGEAPSPLTLRALTPSRTRARARHPYRTQVTTGGRSHCECTVRRNLQPAARSHRAAPTSSSPSSRRTATSLQTTWRGACQPRGCSLSSPSSLRVRATGRVAGSGIRATLGTRGPKASEARP